MNDTMQKNEILRIETGTYHYYIEMKTKAQYAFRQLCIKKAIIPDEKLMKSLGENIFALSIDSSLPEDVTMLCEYLEKARTLHQIQIVLSKKPIKRGLRQKLNIYGLAKPFVASVSGANKILRSVGKMLQHAISMKNVYISNIQITLSTAHFLNKGFLHSTTLTSIDLSDTKMGDESLDRLHISLRQAPNLLYLNLSGCMLTDKSATYISRIIREHSIRRDEKFWSSSLRGREPKLCGHGLVFLNIARNSFGGNIGKQLSDVLVQDKWLLGINLSDNGIGDDGILPLFNALQLCTSLKLLSLSGNKFDISSREAVAIATIMHERKKDIMKYIEDLVAISPSYMDKAYYMQILSSWGYDENALLECMTNHTDEEVILPYHKVEKTIEVTQNHIQSTLTTTNTEPNEDQIKPEVQLNEIMEKMKHMEEAQNLANQRIEDLIKENEALKGQLVDVHKTETIPQTIHSETPIFTEKPLNEIESEREKRKQMIAMMMEKLEEKITILTQHIEKIEEHHDVPKSILSDSPIVIQ